MPSTDTDRIDLTVEIAAPAGVVWSALEQPAAWWEGLSLEPRMGGAFLERWSEDGEEKFTRGRVRWISEREHLVLSWADDDWDTETTVGLRLVPLSPDTTEVHLTHAGWDGFGDQSTPLREAHEAGWDRHLTALRVFCERGAA